MVDRKPEVKKKVDIAGIGDSGGGDSGEYSGSDEEAFIIAGESNDGVVVRWR